MTKGFPVNFASIDVYQAPNPAEGKRITTALIEAIGTGVPAQLAEG